MGTLSAWQNAAAKKVPWLFDPPRCSGFSAFQFRHGLGPSGGNAATGRQSGEGAICQGLPLPKCEWDASGQGSEHQGQLWETQQPFVLGKQF